MMYNVRKIVRKVIKKKFDGKEFIYWNTYPSKSSAKNVANSMREIGDMARIVHTSIGYELFLREGRKKKINKKDIEHDDYIPCDWEMM